VVYIPKNLNVSFEMRAFYPYPQVGAYKLGGSLKVDVDLEYKQPNMSKPMILSHYYIDAKGLRNLSLSLEFSTPLSLNDRIFIWIFLADPSIVRQISSPDLNNGMDLEFNARGLSITLNNSIIIKEGTSLKGTTLSLYLYSFSDNLDRDITTGTYIMNCLAFLLESADTNLKKGHDQPINMNLVLSISIAGLFVLMFTAWCWYKCRKSNISAQMGRSSSILYEDDESYTRHSNSTITTFESSIAYSKRIT
jgi:hypothetical protein